MFVPVKKPYRIINHLYPNKNARWIDKETGLRKNFDGTLERPEFMKIKKHKLTKSEKKVAAKAMYEAGWGSKRISEWFGTSQPTIVAWSKIPTPEALKDFENMYKMAMLDYDMEAIVKIKGRILEIVPKEDDLNKLVKAGEFFNGTAGKKVSQNNTQVNVYGDMLKKYGEKDAQPVSVLKEVR